MVKGTIEVQYINNAHSKIKNIVTQFNQAKVEVNQITNDLKQNWVGDGRDEFEAQYELLMSKIGDFSDALDEIYDALVEAEASYQTTDDNVRQGYVMS